MAYIGFSLKFDTIKEEQEYIDYIYANTNISELKIVRIMTSTLRKEGIFCYSFLTDKIGKDIKILI